jgi:hypothetical protein
MDIQLGSSDQIIVEYYGTMAGLKGEVFEEKADPSESVRRAMVRVALVDVRDVDYYCVLWRYVEGNLEDKWQMMFRDNNVSKAWDTWSGFVGDLICDPDLPHNGYLQHLLNLSYKEATV